MSDGPVRNLVTRAHETHVVVIGGGMAGLAAARACAAVGIRVTLLEASDRLGGCIASAELDGVTLDVAADGFAPGVVRRLADELGLPIVDAARSDRWVSGIPGGAAPIPTDSVLGIPANPWSEEVRRFIGWRGAWRAYVDRLRPPMTIGHERSLGKLVRSRMGDRVRDRMVAPVTRGIFGIAAEEIDVDVAAPGLSTWLTKAGSLAGAVGQLLPRESAPRQSVAGGLTLLVDAMAAHLADLDVDVRLGAVVESFTLKNDGRWTVHLAAQDAESAGGRTATVLDADAVVIATDEVSARRLLSPVAELPTTPPPVAVEVVTLLVEAAALDDPPRGIAVFPVAGAGTGAIDPLATGLVHATAEWPSLAADVGPHRHVVRVTFPQGALPPDFDAAVAAAVAQASALLGAPLAAENVRGADRRAYALARPASAIHHEDDAVAVRASVHAAPGLFVVGAWISGSGLAKVAADAESEAERVRRHALWGDAQAEG